MAYTINLTNGTTLTTVPDGTVNDTSCSLTLIGKNYSGYGTFFNDNIVHLLENSSDSVAPSTPLTGQLWWDTAGNLKVYTGSAFKTLGAITSANSSPSGAVTGNFWWDTPNEQLYAYSGSSWILVGPPNNAGSGTSGFLVGNILDNTATDRVAGNVWVDNYLVAVVSSDQEYTPQTAIPGYTTIKPGINLVSTSNIANVAIWGTASNAAALNGITGSNYARKDIAVTFASTVTSNVGAIIGTNSNLVANLNGINARIINTQTTGNITLIANVVGTLTNSINVDGSTGNVEIGGNLNITNKLTSSSNTTLSGNLILDGSEVLTNAAAANLNVVTSYFSTAASWTATLAAGTNGQIKVFIMLSDGGDMVITVSNPGWGGSGTLTFDNVGESCILQYIANKWFVIGNNGVAIA